MIAFSIPVPPSVNGLYLNVNGRGRAKTPEYRSWLMEAGLMLNRQKPGKVTGPYSVTIRIPAKTRGDVDGRIKACLDLMVEHGITPDDKHCGRVVAERIKGIENACVSVSEWVLE